MSSTLNASVLSAEDIAPVSGGYVDWETNWRGARVAGAFRPKTFVSSASAINRVALNPQPLPPKSNDFGMMF